jgi:hypothetical protein
VHGVLAFFDVTPTVSSIPVQRHKMLKKKREKKPKKKKQKQNNASFNTLTLIALHDSMRSQDYLAVGRFPTIHKRPQQHWKNDMML